MIAIGIELCAAPKHAHDRGVTQLRLCLRSADARASVLIALVQENRKRHLETLRDMSKRMTSLTNTRPESAVEIARAIVELYQDKPWAKNYIDRAKRLIDDAN